LQLFKASLGPDFRACGHKQLQSGVRTDHSADIATIENCTGAGQVMGKAALDVHQKSPDFRVG
jgi:hypothetical protein